MGIYTLLTIAVLTSSTTIGTWTVDTLAGEIVVTVYEDNRPVPITVEVYFITAQEGCGTQRIQIPRWPHAFQLVGYHLAIVATNPLDGTDRVYQLGSCRRLSDAVIFADGFESGSTDAWSLGG